MLRDDGSVLAFGLNVYGQLGDGSTEEAREPVLVSGLPGPAKSVAAVSIFLILLPVTTQPLLHNQNSVGVMVCIIRFCREKSTTTRF